MEDSAEIKGEWRVQSREVKVLLYYSTTQLFYWILKTENWLLKTDYWKLITENWLLKTVQYNKCRHNRWDYNGYALMVCSS